MVSFRQKDAETLVLENLTMSGQGKNLILPTVGPVFIRFFWNIILEPDHLDH